MQKNKMIWILKMELEATNSTKMEATLAKEILIKGTGTTDPNITKRIKEVEESISAIEDSIEEMDTLINENAKCNFF